MEKNIFRESGKTPAELADLIDSLMDGGSGHVNISASDTDGTLTVNTVKSTDVCGVKGACQQPTEFFDDGEE